MRPRSKLLSKRRLLLPTIREGAEEALKELNEANSLHGSALSSEDYFLSICHLAHPTFPARAASPHGGGAAPRADLADRTRPSADARLGREEKEQEEEKEERQPGAGAGLDPLEYLYGHRIHPSGGARRAHGEGSLASLREGRARARAHSVPRASSPELQRRGRKGSFPELGARSAASAPSPSPERSLAGREAPAKHSLICQWISDCRSAWRLARARACMLPAIAEV